MVTTWKGQLLLILTLGLLTLLLTACVDAGEVGRQVGVLFRQLVGLTLQFLYGFIDGCCSGAAAPSAMLIVLAYFNARRRTR